MPGPVAVILDIDVLGSGFVPEPGGLVGLYARTSLDGVTEPEAPLRICPRRPSLGNRLSLRRLGCCCGTTAAGAGPWPPVFEGGRLVEKRRAMPDECLLTADDLLAAGSRWRDCELWSGLPMVREPSGGQAETVAWRVMRRLGNHVEEQALGWVFLSSQGFLLRRAPDTVLAADGAFVAKERLPRVPTHAFVPLAPDFALEVRSPTDSWEAVIEKAGAWIAHGTRVVWAIDPLERRVVVLRPSVPPLLLGPGDRAEATPAIPGIEVAVDELFAGL